MQDCVQINGDAKGAAYMHGMTNADWTDIHYPSVLWLCMIQVLGEQACQLETQIFQGKVNV